MNIATRARIELWIKEDPSGESLLTVLNVQSETSLTQQALERLRDAAVREVANVVFSRIVPLPLTVPLPGVPSDN